MNRFLSLERRGAVRIARRAEQRCGRPPALCGGLLLLLLLPELAAELLDQLLNKAGGSEPAGSLVIGEVALRRSVDREDSVVVGSELDRQRGAGVLRRALDAHALADVLRGVIPGPSNCDSRAIPRCARV